jgi:predicted TIM-barrel fold metal-dependent hydrolase
MGRAVNRREALRGSTALFLLGAAGVGAGATRADAQLVANPPFVDAHCHMFNSADLPLAGFARYSLLRKAAAHGSSFWGPSTLLLAEEITGAKGVLDFIDSLAKAVSTSAEDELRGSPGRFRTDQERIEALLKWSRNVDLPPNIKRPYNPIISLVRKKLKEPGGFQRLLRLMSPNDHAPGAELDPVLKGYAELVVAFASLEFTAGNEAEAQAIRDHARELAAKAFTSNDDLAKQVQLFAVGLRPRADIVREWDRIMVTKNGAGAQAAFGASGWSNRLRIYTPAMVDYDFWVQDVEVAREDCTPRADALGDPCPLPATTPLMLQNDVWSMVAAQFAASAQDPIVVHPMTTFDPLRYVYETHGRNFDSPPPGSALDLVKRAIETQGFVGVKVYPPMGFLPIKNADMAARLDEFKREPKRPWGDRARDVFWAAGVRDRSDPYREIDLQGAALDGALNALYTYCAAKNVPIMAHTSRSQGTFYDDASWKAADLAADPLLWRDVLEMHPTLRLNLAHAGGPWCLGAVGKNDHENYDKRETNLLDRCELDQRPSTLASATQLSGRTDLPPEFGYARWPIRALQLVSLMKNGKPAYPNLFMDFGDWDQLGERQDDGTLWRHAKQAADRMAMIMRGAGGHPDFNPQLIRRRIMYGSDWIVMGRSHYAEDYFNVVMRTLVEEGVLARDATDTGGMSTTAFAGGNALDFLGLSAAGDAGIRAASPGVKPEDTPLGRLQAFYARGGSGAKWAAMKAALGLA